MFCPRSSFCLSLYQLYGIKPCLSLSVCDRLSFSVTSKGFGSRFKKKISMFFQVGSGSSYLISLPILLVAQLILNCFSWYWHNGKMADIFQFGWLRSDSTLQHCLLRFSTTCTNLEIKCSDGAICGKNNSDPHEEILCSLWPLFLSIQVRASLGGHHEGAATLRASLKDMRLFCCGQAQTGDLLNTDTETETVLCHKPQGAYLTDSAWNSLLLMQNSVSYCLLHIFPLAEELKNVTAGYVYYHC